MPGPSSYLHLEQIPDKPLDQPRPRPHSVAELPNPHPTPAQLAEETQQPPTETDVSTETTEDDTDDEGVDGVPPIRVPPKRRRLSTYESSDGGMDLEDEVIGGSARR